MKTPVHNIKLYSNNNILCPDSTWYKIAPHWYQNSARGWLATGLKDKNGVEIYEGDIINVFEPGSDGWTDIVLFEGGAFKLKDYDDLLDSIAPQCEVVGHIATEDITP